MVCKHESSQLVKVRELDYECEEYIKFLIHDICNDCGALLNEEVHVFKFSHRDGIFGHMRRK